MITTESTPSKFKPYTRQTIHLARQWQWMTPELQEAVQVVSHVLPFRVNAYVLEELIDWDKVPDDPIYRLTFPHRDMLPSNEYEQLRELVLYKKDETAIAKLVHGIRMRMNPHPAGQMTHNVPRVNDAPLKGLQHKYLCCCKTSLFCSQLFDVNQCRVSGTKSKFKHDYSSIIGSVSQCSPLRCSHTIATHAWHLVCNAIS